MAGTHWGDRVIAVCGLRRLLCDVSLNKCTEEVIAIPVGEDHVE